MANQILLYYRYISVPDPEAERQAQLELCAQLGLKGRILVGTEGINGTVAGSAAAIGAYRAAMNQHTLFGGIDFKISDCDGVPFPKLSVKVRSEIVSSGASVDLGDVGTSLTPRQFHALIQDPNVAVFDARNRYESAIGKFEGAITPDIELFKELPREIDRYSDLKDKPVALYCTGGIRCEKASALFRAKGFKQVYQLEGGIIKYAEEFPEGAFKGRCFVFDERMSVAFKDDPEILGTCRHCSAQTSDYYNCAYKPCNELMLFCIECRERTEVCGPTCSRKLKELAVEA